MDATAKKVLIAISIAVPVIPLTFWLLKPRSVKVMTPVATEPLRGLPAKGRIPAKSVDFAMKKLAPKVEKCGITKSMLREGMSIEREHGDVTKRGVEKTARVAVAHLCERKDYYKRLKRYVEK
jgi:hypothetical protein